MAHMKDMMDGDSLASILQRLRVFPGEEAPRTSGDEKACQRHWSAPCRRSFSQVVSQRGGPHGCTGCKLNGGLIRRRRCIPRAPSDNWATEAVCRAAQRPGHPLKVLALEIDIDKIRESSSTISLISIWVHKAPRAMKAIAAQSIATFKM
ncbi:hypothetical protein BKA93DRAFT_127984 [Sparassis latifolia]